ncbi:hypothetical protein XELAEV_18010280mg [Xenopus laevis]|uniref:Uncharacterized protein n=1 Tax=Xenopus laevis TaxID=8355 RepID=A0A974DWA7_XENLA|nr:hypothetical protein XELAEV_18010280mg [Xenopus laevis]
MNYLQNIKHRPDWLGLSFGFCCTGKRVVCLLEWSSSCTYKEHCKYFVSHFPPPSITPFPITFFLPPY